jgi:DNA ligase (NAD+)
VLFALGITHVGNITADTLAGHFGTVDALMAADAEEIATVEGIGPVIAEAVAAWFIDEQNRQVVEGLRAAGVNLSGPIRERSDPEGPLAGLSVVVTGSIEGYTRDSIREHLTSLGAKVGNSISAGTDYLVAGSGGGSKRAKAEKLGVAVVTLDELMEKTAGEM